MKKKCYICGSKDVVYEYDGEYFCSEWCLREYIERKGLEYDEATIEQKLFCDICGEEIYECDYCNWRFKPDDSILCTPHGHFCSEECYYNYLIKEYSTDLKKEVLKKL